MTRAFPEPFVALTRALTRALRAGDDDAARAAQQKVVTAVAATGAGDIALLKQGLALRGLPAGAPRAAVPRPAAEPVARLRRAVSALAAHV